MDTGGTFTDFVFETSGGFHVFKIASTPDDPSRAIAEGLEHIVSETRSRWTDVEVVHGTTVGTNALLQRRGARTALVTTAGFEDVIEIGRQARPELYNLDVVRLPALVPDELRFGVSERVAASGDVLQKLSTDELEALAKKLRTAQVEAIAISLLFSFAHPDHETRIAKALAKPGLPLSVSHRILPEYREYERTSTVVINAYLQPLMGEYLSRLGQTKRRPKSHVSSLKLRVMQSSGGSISAGAAADEPVRTILSGPAGGVVGALHAGHAARFEQLITFDMGGTSTDVALCDREGMRLTNEAVVAGLPVAVPMMDIHTVGAGGGSIARVDAGGSLRVGPESAGANPGPASYGRSILPTVTDAHVVLKHFPGAALLGGEFPLDQKRARHSLDKLAEQMSAAARRRVSAIAAALGVIDVVNTNMERALRHISVERGHDPRDFVLVPFGGAGGLHAVALARSLRIPQVFVPSSPGALSAIGVITADVIKDQSRTIMWQAEPGIEMKLERVFRQIESDARAILRAEGFSDPNQRHERSLAVRYKGQSFDLEIRQTSGGIARAFHRAHELRYGYAQEENIVEIVSARVRSLGLLKKSKAKSSRNRTATRIAKPSEFIETYFDRRKTRAAVYRRGDLESGCRLRAPCIVTEYSATTLVPAGAKAATDAQGNLIIYV